MKYVVNEGIEDYEYQGRKWNAGDKAEFDAPPARMVLAHMQEVDGEAVQVFRRVKPEDNG